MNSIEIFESLSKIYDQIQDNKRVGAFVEPQLRSSRPAVLLVLYLWRIQRLFR